MILSRFSHPGRANISRSFTPIRLVNGRPPAQADIQRFFQVTPPSVHQMLLTLERGGLISRRPGAPRSIAVLVDRSALPALEPGHGQPVKTTVSRSWFPSLSKRGVKPFQFDPCVGGRELPVRFGVFPVSLSLPGGDLTGQSVFVGNASVQAL